MLWLSPSTCYFLHVQSQKSNCFFFFLNFVGSLSLYILVGSVFDDIKSLKNLWVSHVCEGDL